MGIIVLGLFSCEKVIKINFKDAAPRVVIEALIDDDTSHHSYNVFVSRSNNFYSDGSNTPISGAFITIKDLTLNITDTLSTSTQVGKYSTNHIKGISGHTYTIDVTIDNQTYSAQSTMPNKVSLDSLYIQEIPIQMKGFAQIVPVFKDPKEQLNYYRFSVKVNDSLLRNYDAWDDVYTDGKENSRTYPVFAKGLFKGKDTLTVFMNCTDKGMYDFFFTLNNAAGNAQSPSNPTSCFNNGAIGYFGAVTVQQKSIILP